MRKRGKRIRTKNLNYFSKHSQEATINEPIKDPSFETPRSDNIKERSSSISTSPTVSPKSLIETDEIKVALEGS